MITTENLVGNKYYKLTPIEQLKHYKNGRTFYKCICDCGNEVILYGSSIKHGKVKDCGNHRGDKKREDISGKKFGKLTAIKPLYSNNKSNIVWECRCECGNITTATVASLKSGNKQSCGCYRQDILKERLDDLTGKRYGMLTVLEYAYSKGKARYWKCKCDCGNIKLLTTNVLSMKHTQSCGCTHHICKTKTHDMSRTPIYHIWKSMRQRCNNKNDKAYKHYGERGIKVCDEWSNFESFYNWAINNGYQEEALPNGKNKWTIDRIDNNGNYEPSNCRFVTNYEQLQNRSNTIYLKYKDKKQTLSELSKINNISRDIIYNRIRRGWTVEDAVEKPLRSW